MGRYLIRRLLWMVVLLFLVSAMTFVVFYVFPSTDPAQLRAGRSASPATVAVIRKNLGLDQPVTTQYFRYMKNVVTKFDFGYSYQDSQNVRGEIVERIPATLSLTAGAVLVWLLVGLSVGIVSAVRRRSLLDRAAMGGALLAISAPVYWLGLVALYLFSKDIGRFPIFEGSGTYVPLTQDPGQWLGSLILPWLVLAASFAAFYARLLRANL